jgi:hypothetical protein
MKDFVPYELALELKELGYDEPNHFLKWYDSKGKIREGLGLGEVKAPLYQQAFRWFREKYDIHYSINRECSQHDHKWGYNWSLYNYTGIFDEFLTSHPDAPAGEWVYETYEEAERECLKEIIKIINEKD